MRAWMRRLPQRHGVGLDVQDLEVRYRGAVGLHSVTLHADPGETIAIVGPNGAGKTTLLRAISGFIPGDRAQITRGRIAVGGRSVAGGAPSTIARQGVALVPERDKVFAQLTVWQNLDVVGIPGGPPKQDLEELVELFPILGKRRHQLAGSLSGGERQMLAIARALLLKPNLLLVDELSFGLAPVVIESIVERLSTVVNVDRTVVIVEQNLTVAAQLAHRGYALSAGQVVADAPIGELAELVASGEVHFGSDTSGAL